LYVSFRVYPYHESQNSHSSPDISSTLEETQLIVRLPLPYLLFSINARAIVRIYACVNISINDCAIISICIYRQKYYFICAQPNIYENIS